MTVIVRCNNCGAKEWIGEEPYKTCKNCGITYCAKNRTWSPEDKETSNKTINKEAIGDNDYIELRIVYLEGSFANEGRFDICGTTEKDLIDSRDRGECFYKGFTNYKADGKVTLKGIEETIFG